MNNSEAIFIFCVFLSFWLTAGDPDIIDAIVYYLMQ